MCRTTPSRRRFAPATRAWPGRPRETTTVRALPASSGSVTSSRASSRSIRCGGSSATPWEARVRSRSTGSPPAPTSGISVTTDTFIPVMEQLELILEFVNTVDFEEDREELDSAAALQRWLAAHGLVSESARAVAADLRAALTLREAIRELALANNRVEVDAGEAAHALEWAASRARLVVRFGQ